MKTKRVFFIILLCISMVGNIVFFTLSVAAHHNKSIEGTYCSTSAENSNVMKTEYIVFSERAEYTRYQPQKLLEKGTYRTESESPLVYLSEAVGHYDGKNTFILFEEQNAVTFSRISEIPIYAYIQESKHE